MSIQETWTDYLKTLAVSHREIGHIEGKRDRFAYNLKKSSQQVFKGEPEIVLQHDDLTGSMRGHTDELIPVLNAGFVVWCSYRNDDVKSEMEAFEKSFRIGSEILAKIIHDGSEGCSPFQAINPTAITFRQVGPESLNFVGYLFKFPVSLISSDINIEFNQSQWQS